MDPRDPVQRSSDDSLDLYDVVEWDSRSVLDRVSVLVYRGLHTLARTIIVVVAVAILLAQVFVGGLGAVIDPVLGALTILSAVPAFVLTAYVWRSDVTSREPVGLLVSTFLLGVLFAGFAAIVTGLLQPAFVLTGATLDAPVIGTIGLFYLVIGPVEEGVKLLAVRLQAFTDDRFDAVVDGAVYGAAAGLGFATIENALYITSQTIGESGLGLLAAGGSVATVRALAGPGHVIYSAFAGYYLGLAKFNPQNAGPIVVKGLLIAALIHGTYNSLVWVVPFAVADVLSIAPLFAVFWFVVVFDGFFVYLLIRKLRTYRKAYNATHHDRQRPPAPELTEFEP
ncbi:MAG: PrsW family intramembrane metalloprotease [Halorhabdus sp.]